MRPIDFLIVENQPANIFSALWCFHCKLIIYCCRNLFVLFFIWCSTKIVSYSVCCQKSAKQSDTPKRMSSRSQGCCTSRLGHSNLEIWFEIYLPSKQPESRTLWRKRHPIFFLYLHRLTLFQLHFVSTLPPSLRNYFHWSRHDVYPRREWSKKMHTHHWMGRWKCQYVCRIHFQYLFPQHQI